jgi:hypothetical protein
VTENSDLKDLATLVQNRLNLMCLEHTYCTREMTTAEAGKICGSTMTMETKDLSLPKVLMIEYAGPDSMLIDTSARQRVDDAVPPAAIELIHPDSSEAYQYELRAMARFENAHYTAYFAKKNK